MVLLLGSFPFLAYADRIANIRPGMTRTDVAIQLGAPLEVRQEGEATLWIYPKSDSEICQIKFLRQKVTQEPMKCDNSEAIRPVARMYMPALNRMNSDQEYQGRVKRYCGIKPKPDPGCRVLEQCVNGGWEIVCDHQSASASNSDVNSTPGSSP